MVKLNCVQEVELSLHQKVSTLAKFAFSPRQDEKCSETFLLPDSWVWLLRNRTIRLFCNLPLRILRLQYLRDLRMAGPSFSAAAWNQILR